MLRKFLAIVLLCSTTVSGDQPGPNILMITVDDMSCDSVGAFDCPLPGTTPNIDQLAKQGMRYHYAHVQVGNCYPSRNVMFSGRYPHNTGVEGFYQVKNPPHPHLVDLMKAAGYFVAIRGKVSHSTPYQPYDWDADLTKIDGQTQHGKNAKSYFISTQKGIELAKQANQPFCLSINISDPHKPFYGINGAGAPVKDSNVPSRIFQPEEVPIPGFLFDHPDVRKELAHYYSSVRRADDCVGEIIKALNASGQKENTVILFLSDHGMPLPFAKTALWHHSTRTPWIVKWPGVTHAGKVDRTHMISAVDLLPTVLDIAGAKHPAGMDGKSFSPLLHGKSQSGRETVYKVYNENAGGNRSPMRSVQSKKYGYLFNPWSDGQRVFATATTGTLTYRAMQKLAPDNPEIAARLKHFRHNTPEEFYDYENDPDAKNNLINDSRFAKAITEHRAIMKRYMQQSNDPMLEVFQKRSDPIFVSDYVDRVQAVSDTRRQSRRKTKPLKGNQKKDSKLFQLILPTQLKRDASLVVEISHQLPADLGKQMFHVTLKKGNGERISRKVVSGSGSGSLKVNFDLPNGLDTDSVIISTFVGASYPTNRLHRTSKPIALK